MLLLPVEGGGLIGPKLEFIRGDEAVGEELSLVEGATGSA